MCETPLAFYCSICNCDLAGSTEAECNITTGQCSCLPATSSRDCSQCSEGTFNLQSSNPDGCQPCFCSGLSDSCSAADGFYSARLVTTFNGTDMSLLQGWRLFDSSGNATDVTPYPNGAGMLIQGGIDAFLASPAHFLGNRLSSYARYLSVDVSPVADGVNLEVTAMRGVILIGGGVTIVSNFSRTESGLRVHLHESAGWTCIGDPSITLTSRDFQAVLSSLSELVVSAQYNTDVVLVSISLDTAIHKSELADLTDAVPVTSVENCTCPQNFTGLSCELCAAGYTRTSSGTCEPCECNGFSSNCDPESGECIDCSENTAGSSCEACATGFYGDPVGGVACLPCPCPLTSAPGQFSEDCELTDSGNVSCLSCPPGHTGEYNAVQREIFKALNFSNGFPADHIKFIKFFLRI